MIATALLLSQVQGVRVTELPEAGAARLEVQAIIKLPADLSPRERGALAIIRDCLTQGTRDYSKDELQNYALLVGEPIKVTLAYDHFRIGYSLPPRSLDVASDLVSNLVRGALFRDEDCLATLALAPFKSFPAWQSSLSNWSVDYRNLRLAEVRQVYERYFRPENLCVAVSGPFGVGEVIQEFEQRFQDWKPAAVRRIYEGKSQELYKSQAINTIGLWADISGVPFAQLELVSIALGLGKDGAAFRVIRNELGQSYRQEGVVAPGPKGLRLGVVYQSTSSDGGVAALAALAKDIEAWNQATLTRSIATISALSSLGMTYSSIYLDPSLPLTATPADQAYWTAYATANKLPVDRRAILAAMSTVTLDQLKTLAKRWASEAKIEVNK
ncbi:MAG: hypothetical protein ABL949_13765 [Fimbriimonadaceae bacterium]